MMTKEKTYLYEVRLAEKLMEEVKYFANQWNEEIDLCIERTLKLGLIARKQIKEKHMSKIYKALEEQEKSWGAYDK